MFPSGLMLLFLAELAELQQLYPAAAAATDNATSSIQANSDQHDSAWVFSVESVSRMVPLLQRAEAATRLRSIVMDFPRHSKGPPVVLLHPTPVSPLHQLKLLQSAREAFAAEEQLLPGISEYHARTLLLVLHAATSARYSPREALRQGLSRAGLATAVLDMEAALESEVPNFSGPRKDTHSKFIEESESAVEAAEAFVRDLQRLTSSNDTWGTLRTEFSSCGGNL
ncbi:hypothetical protein, conserved [Eimeria tenella]|uniref:Uncharacterized protein n=1 Tax=Eimeria tenella TaxID=5802 RepID=U6KS18_EIMTE|nr:hypothetical protein, conserved [Eimeria tenella]CDJ40766.1 hypothetical protein, conserved [Eimeria tenella]|eukprot:XP_013231516.1 hypothetical protein, conserved [Eimeria tenella]